MFQSITSTQNEAVKLARSLHKRKKRHHHQMMLLEGRRLIMDAFLHGAVLDTVFMTANLVDDVDLCTFCEQVQEAGGRIVVIPESIMQSISETVNSQGLIAIAQYPRVRLADLKRPNRVLVLNNIQDPGNMGTLIRSAAAFAVDLVLVTANSCDIYNPKTLRSTMATLFQVPIVDQLSSEECIAYLHDHKIPILATVLGRKSLSLKHYRAPDTWAVVLGNEGAGIESIWQENATVDLIIPMAGAVESLNVAVAGSIVLYQLCN